MINILYYSSVETAVQLNKILATLGAIKSKIIQSKTTDELENIVTVEYVKLLSEIHSNNNDILYRLSSNRNYLEDVGVGGCRSSVRMMNPLTLTPPRDYKFKIFVIKPFKVDLCDSIDFLS